jgi:hypothetical protein
MQDLRQRLLIVVIASYQVIIGAARDRQDLRKIDRITSVSDLADPPNPP